LCKHSDKVVGELKISVQVVEYKNWVENEKEPELITAVKNSQLMRVSSLLEDPKTNVNQLDQAGYTPLHTACTIFSDNDDEILTALLRCKGINVSLSNPDGNTPLHYFCQKFHSPNCSGAFELFLQRGADVNAANLYAETPLHKAVFNSKLRVLITNLLLKAGVAVNAVNKYGETALHYTARLRSEDLVSILLRGGADITLTEKRTNKTALQIAESENDANKKIVAKLQNAKKLFDFLVELNMVKYRLILAKEEIDLDTLRNLEAKILQKIGIEEKDAEIMLEQARVRGEQTKLEEPSSPFNMKEVLGTLKYKRNTANWELNHNDLEFFEKLGQGTSGTVYRGAYKKTQVAIKHLRLEQEKEIKEFTSEFQIMNAINSPYLIFFFGAVLHPKMYLVMELCGKGSLYSLMNDPSFQISWSRVFEFVFDMCRGLEVLHNSNPPIYHRDFKSMNLMVSDDYHVKVGDFGLSRFDTESKNETLSKMRGTFAYLCPEVYGGKKHSKAADIYSLSIVLWELINRCVTHKYSRPYSEHTNLKLDYQIIIAVSRNGIRPKFPAQTPERFAELVRSCWCTETDRRPSIEQVIESILELRVDYNNNKAQWDAAITPQIQSKAEEN
jgi:ankyrin repeat protein